MVPYELCLRDSAGWSGLETVSMLAATFPLLRLHTPPPVTRFPLQLRIRPLQFTGSERPHAKLPEATPFGIYFPWIHSALRNLIRPSRAPILTSPFPRRLYFSVILPTDIRP